MNHPYIDHVGVARYSHVIGLAQQQQQLNQQAAESSPPQQSSLCRRDSAQHSSADHVVVAGAHFTTDTAAANPSPIPGFPLYCERTFEDFYGDFQGPSKASSLVYNTQDNLLTQPDSDTIALESNNI